MSEVQKSQDNNVLSQILQLLLEERAEAKKAKTEDSALQQLVQLMLSEREGAMQERRAKAEAVLQREKQRRIQAELQIREREQSQALCSHKKNQRGIKDGRADFALSHHTFTDGSSYVRCLICGMKWKPGDTAEFLVRRGERISNHTGIGWKTALDMVLKNSTNTATSSEVLTKVERPVPTATDFVANPAAVEI